jgi:thioredoxin reductase (NADPH)
MQETMYDVIIVGGGPGGLTAGIYASRSRLKTVLIEKGKTGGQAATTEAMENYPGFPKGTTGPGLMEAMTEHAKEFGCEFLRDEITGIEVKPDGTKVVKGKRQDYTTKAVITGPGAEPRMLGIKGEGRLRGKGVSYCATCDADFYTDLDVVILGNGDAAVEEAMYLTKFVNSATIVVIHDEGVLDATKIIQERAFANPKLKWIWTSTVDEICGDEMVEKVIVKNIKTNEKSEVECNGVFIFVGTVPKTEFLKGVIDMDQRGYVKTNDLMETSVDGLYCVGDARQKYLRQVITSAADGAIAAVAAEKYLVEEESFHQQIIAPQVPVMVTFWSVSSEASMALIGTVEKIAEKHGDALKLAKIDTYKSQRIAKRLNVTEIPTVIFMNHGQEISRLSGNIDAATIEAQLAKLIK